jgi:phospholipase/lecithinase/hemolysin
MNHHTDYVLLSSRYTEIHDTIGDWNQRLEQCAFQFGNTTKDATVLLFSSSKFLNGILDDPEKHGFTKEDVKKRAGGIWSDHIHLTDPVHEILSTQIMAAIVP